MGCDIHVFVEKRANKNLPWQVDEIHQEDADDDVPYIQSIEGTNRDYDLFGRIAGVRGRDVHYKQRGIPDNISQEILRVIERWGNDGHSYSWLSLNEFKDALLRDSWYQDAPDNGYVEMIHYCEKWIEIEEAEAILLNLDIKPEVRIVFFFDN